MTNNTFGYFDYEVTNTQHHDNNSTRSYHYLLPNYQNNQLTTQQIAQTPYFDYNDQQQLNSTIPVTTQAPYGNHVQQYSVQPSMCNRQQPQLSFMQNGGHVYSHSYSNWKQTQDQLQVHQQQNYYYRQCYPANLCQGNYMQHGYGK